MKKYNLLEEGKAGGCSAKIPPGVLTSLLQSIPMPKDKNVMVDITTHDDAGVYRLNDTTALIVTTDFFPPVCADPYTFGQIAATNALSDIYAMGGTPLLTLNLNLFPSEKQELEVLRLILEGGQSKVNEAGAFTMGGHTIVDDSVKYGLAVVGTVHPDKLITNGGVRIGQRLILTKPLGTGIVLAAHRLELCSDTLLNEALQQMSTLNKKGAAIMQRFGVTGATDVTGFGLLGHALEMARAANVTLTLHAATFPRYEGVMELLYEGVVPGSLMNNLRHIEASTTFAPSLSVEEQLLLCDAQTSGGLLLAVDADAAEEALAALQQHYPYSTIIGEVHPKGTHELVVL